MTRTHLHNRNALTDSEDRIGVAKSGGGRIGSLGFSRCKLFHTELINNKTLLYSTGNYRTSPMTNHSEK